MTSQNRNSWALREIKKVLKEEGNPLAKLWAERQIMKGQSSNDDFRDRQRGANYIPGEVTYARRDGNLVTFVQDCVNKCCWYWLMPNGKKIYHWDRGSYLAIANSLGQDSKGKVGPCPICGNAHLTGED